MTLNGFGTGSSVSNNTITNITGQGALTGLTVGSTGNATNLLINNNTITGLSSTGTGGDVLGINSSNNSTTSSIYNNSINTFSSSGGTATVTGIQISGGTGTTNVYSHTIYALSGTGTISPQVFGISILGGSSLSIYKNKIYNLTENGINSGAIVSGISFTGSATTVTASNNLISDLQAPNTSYLYAIRGVNYNTLSSTTSFKLYYNTVYLTGNSTGTNFGGTALYHYSSGIATTCNLLQKTIF